MKRIDFGGASVSSYPPDKKVAQKRPDGCLRHPTKFFATGPPQGALTYCLDDHLRRACGRIDWVAQGDKWSWMSCVIVRRADNPVLWN
jgi:hypothetical protein